MDFVGIVRRLGWLLPCLLWVALARAQSSGTAVTTTTPISSVAYEGAHIFKTTRGMLFGFNVSYHTAATRTILVFDATAVPANGATTSCTLAYSNGCLLRCFEGDSQSTDTTESFKAKSFVIAPLVFKFGMVIAASTSSSGCASLTLDGANEWFDAQVQ